MEYDDFKMALKGKKWSFKLSSLPEVFVSSKATSSAVSKAVKSGRLRKLSSRLYTKNLTETPGLIVRRNWHSLLKEYFPDALIADRTALENRPAPDGSVFIISSGTRAVDLPGIKFRPRKGHPPLENDLPFLGEVHLSSGPRAWLENMRKTRARSANVARTLSESELEERLDSLLRQGGETALNKLRDEARGVSRQLGMPEEFHVLDELIGEFLGTRDTKLESPAGRARKRGLPYDPERLEFFGQLFEELRGRSPVTRTAANMTDSAKTNLSFFEAYFSNYIEGTEFPVEEAMDIVFHGVIPHERPEDAHDILETYRVVADYRRMARTPRSFDDFVSSLKERHATIMAMRPGKMPGQFKSKENRAGNTYFVLPSLVLGTLAKGFELYRGIEVPLHRAIFMMFLVSEVHPFVDGNGRVARIMMNGEFVAAGEQKIIIPTVYRDDYITALKALSQSGRSTPLVQVLDFAQRYTCAIQWDDINTARANLQATHAFLDANEADDKGIRLVLPKNVG
jgi:fido (protein-threonine AMPylation protein)